MRNRRRYKNITATLDRKRKNTMKEIVDMIPDDVNVAKCSAGYFTTFTRFDFHRGINVKKPMRRLLVRLTETDVILPRNKPYLHAVGT